MDWTTIYVVKTSTQEATSNHVIEVANWQTAWASTKQSYFHVISRKEDVKNVNHMMPTKPLQLFLPIFLRLDPVY